MQQLPISVSDLYALVYGHLNLRQDQTHRRIGIEALQLTSLWPGCRE